jgi:RHS repeat-associated protein
VTVTYGYDGRLLSDQTWTGAVTGNVQYDYDSDFRLASESVNGGGGAMAFVYDADGLLTQAGGLTQSRSPQNGWVTGTTLGSISDACSYTPYGEVSAWAATFGGAGLVSLVYERDDLGRIVETTETIDGAPHIYGYGYDLAGRLTDVARDAALTAHYDYDANGNRLSRTTPAASTAATYDDQDRLLSYGTMSYTYQAGGELATKVDSATGETTGYVYDALGTLRTVTLPGGTAVDYLVDGENRRVGKKVGGVLVQGWLWRNALHVVAELDGAGNVVARFVYTTGANAPAMMVKGGATYRILTDHLGSPRVVVDAATGVVAQRMDYDEFGVVTLDTNPGFQPFGFAGGLYDADTGLVRFGARDFDPATGRWVLKDPSRFAGGLNLYQYCESDPVNCTDPSGRWPQWLDHLLDQLFGPRPPSSGPTGKPHAPYDNEPCGVGDYCRVDTLSPERPGGTPYRTPGEREPEFPGIEKCKDIPRVEEMAACCRRECNHREDQLEACPRDPSIPKDPAAACFEACMDPYWD